MKKAISVFIFLIVTTLLFAQNNNEIYLIIRSDDIGSFHAANVGCIESYQNGITQSVELMPPCPWFFEAVEMLNENPKLDVGIHLTLTSEWDRIKWRPITHCPGLTDEAGNFFPMVWKNKNYPPNCSILESDWTIEEVEKELRAQIELSLKHVQNISHISSHMGFESLDSQIKTLIEKLAKEYNLYVDMSDVKRFPGWGKDVELEDRVDTFCSNLQKMTPGKYLFVEHPAKNFQEMKPVGHIHNNDVAIQREWVTRVFTSEKVKQVIQG
ncbi:MAG: ChbG/HpnK family deacetylase, partial [Draconibacterium sp.]|nr:ChbG/HpnK family deacetylase [Draconibacterium sp.]